MHTHAHTHATERHAFAYVNVLWALMIAIGLARETTAKHINTSKHQNINTHTRTHAVI